MDREIHSKPASSKNKRVSKTYGSAPSKDFDETDFSESTLMYSSETDSLLMRRDKLKPPVTMATTWRRWLIGVVTFLYLFAYITSFYVVIEFTNKRCLDDEFLAANLSQANISSDTCLENTTGIVYETQTRATEKSSRWLLYYSLAHGLPAIMANLVLGSYTDSLGRKFLLLVGIVGTTLRLLLSTLVIYLEGDLLYTLLSLCIDGFTGQFATCVQTTLAYVSDITTAKTRTLGMIFAEVVIGVALSSASFSTGFIVGAYGYILPMVISSAMLLLDLFIVLFLLPETFGKEKRRKHKSILKMLKTSVQFVTEDDHDRKRWKYQLMLLINFLCSLSFLARIPVETLYQMASPFCWSEERVGVYAAVRTLVAMIAGMGLVSLLQRCLDEVTLCMMGVASYAATFYWTAYVEDALGWYIIIAVCSLSSASTTMQRSILSLLTSPDKQGAIFAALAALEVLSTLLSNVTLNAIYTATVSSMRGFVFLVMGSLNVVCLILLIVFKIGCHLEKKR